ncbi:MAG: hypothetical protein K2K70_12975 [Lachnospiraceae bacterium]|nr:hypothetical protein [Lachnospiraceae bacterium]
MEKTLYNNLWANRLLKNPNEIAIFEDNLAKLAESFNENDIIELCQILDDKTDNSEVMFGIIHLLETLSTEQAFINTVIGVVKLKSMSPEWANIIIYRCLNDEYCVRMIREIYVTLDNEIRTEFSELLKEIKRQDYEIFGKAVSEIIY